MTELEKIVVIVDSDLEELIPGFLDNRNTDIENLNAALSDGKVETLQSIGHSLKGVGGGYGFDGLSDIGAEIESEAKSGNLNGIGVLIEKMRNYLGRIEVSFE
jgi:HPt (histidine-containing phosphotransfer) domain-containing protein